jgi:hypothetical protein
MVAEVVPMAKATRLEIGERDMRRLEGLVRSRSVSSGMSDRAKILLGRAEGRSIDAVAAEVAKVVDRPCIVGTAADRRTSQVDTII